MSDALFDEPDEEDAAIAITAWLIVGPVAETSEALNAMERAFLAAGPARRLVVFEDEDGSFLNADQFQAAMSWPCRPTMDETMAWKLDCQRSAV